MMIKFVNRWCCKRFLSLQKHTGKKKHIASTTANKSLSNRTSTLAPRLLDISSDHPMRLLSPSALECLPHITPLGVQHRPTTDLSLCCTEIDSKGRIQFSMRSFTKVDIAKKYNVVPRDLRKMDDNFAHQLPAILVRPQSILLNIEDIKAIIKKDRVVLFNPKNNAGRQLVHSLVSEIEDTFSIPPTDYERDLPYELRLLEILLRTCVTGLREEADLILPQVENFLHSTLKMTNICKETLTSLLFYSKKISLFQSRVTSVRNAITEILNCDEDLTTMNLSVKDSFSKYTTRATDHDEAEMLLETYLKQSEEVLARINQVDEDISSTEDILNISLDSQRNAMLLLELRLAMGTFAAANGAFIASLFGMNLTSGYEDNPLAFWLVSGGSAGLVSAVFILCIRHLKRLNSLIK